MSSLFVIVGWIAGTAAFAGLPPGLTEVASHPDHDRTSAVTSDLGAVWVTTDGGAHWREVLAPVEADPADDFLAEVEARLGELSPVPDLSAIEEGDLDEDELQDAIQAAADDAAADARQVVEDVRSEIEAHAPGAPHRPRLWFTAAGELVVARVDGLWVSEEEATRWSLVLQERVTAFAEVPAGGAVAGTATGLLASATGVHGWATVSALVGVEVFDLVVLDRQVYASTSDGPWVSEGEGWQRTTLAVPVLPEPVVPSFDGLLGPSSSAGPARIAEWVPLRSLVDAALGRAELTGRPGRRFAAALLPELSVDCLWVQEVGDSWNADTWTLRNVDTAWAVHGTLTWAVGSAPDGVDEVEVDDLQPIVFEDEVVVDDGSASWLLVSRVGRGATVYGSDLARTVGDLYVRRQGLAVEQNTHDEPLIDRVRRTLQVAELDARLDVLSGGAVSAWAAGPDVNGGGDR